VVQVNKCREWKRQVSMSIDPDELLHLEHTHQIMLEEIEAVSEAMRSTVVALQFASPHAQYMIDQRRIERSGGTREGGGGREECVCVCV
jgi:hypothetical protein